MLVFYFFASIVIALGVLSLRAGFSFARYVRAELGRPHSDFTPFVSVIAPCRGLESGLQTNLEGLCRQRYPTYEIVFVTDSDADLVVNLIEEVIAELEEKVTARIVIAGDAVDRGQKDF